MLLPATNATDLAKEMLRGHHYFMGQSSLNFLYALGAILSCIDEKTSLPPCHNHLTWTAAISDTSSNRPPQLEGQSEKFILLRLLLFMIYNDGGGDISRKEGRKKEEGALKKEAENEGSYQTDRRAGALHNCRLQMKMCQP